MDYRKLIAFGKNSFVISVPKQWIKHNKLNKGDLIYLDESGPNLILSKKESQRLNTEKEKTISIDGKSLKRIQREVNSAYVLNHRKITLKGEEIRTRLGDLQRIFDNLIALEVMEQTPDEIMAKDFLSMSKVSVKETFQKMDVVIRAMFKEINISFTEETYNNITERDRYVDRLYLLLYRTVLFNLDNPLRSLKNLQLNSIELHNFLLSGFYLEGIADELRRIARFSYQLSISDSENKSLSEFLDKLYKYYLETIKAYHSGDGDLALGLSDYKAELNLDLDKLKDRNKDVEHYANLISRIRRLISFNHNLGRLAYQDCNYFSENEF